MSMGYSMAMDIQTSSFSFLLGNDFEVFNLILIYFGERERERDESHGERETERIKKKLFFFYLDIFKFLFVLKYEKKYFKTQKIKLNEKRVSKQG